MGTACSPVRGAVEVERRAGQGPVISLTVDPAEPVFSGHYPGFPIFPGVCVVEFVHRGALATIPDPDRSWELSRIDKVRFLAPVRPGDRLTADITWERQEDGWRCAAAVGTERGSAAQVRIRFSERKAR
ncbi:hypothetical protein ABZ545_06390 [Streptomyces abikoensis]|uniref:3-hydroxyacyl-ACP dehydratase FabZ family protein n=1 Tax=Streptomyces abikoensis TaxID=97398 RepID=UPI0033F9FE97